MEQWNCVKWSDRDFHRSFLQVIAMASFAATEQKEVVEADDEDEEVDILS